ncbi:MAG: signal peptidase I [Chloroflexi bacterium]|nr:signal peptidase I [Chloroflexota bacterium]
MVILNQFTKSLILSILFIVFLSFIFSSFEVKGRSMEPTLISGDRVLVLNLNYINLPFTNKKLIIQMPKKNSLLVFHSDETNVDLVKRVIGLPNDEIDIKNNTVYVNGEIQSRGITLTTPKNNFPLIIDENCIFVLGDNRNFSNDSRYFGCVPLYQFKGEIALRIWPIDKFKLFR